ncbi:RPB5 subunit of DNA-directed RNA polymerase [Neoconidiobolus thromboides FSU 785]|nr:RPB5 subunit of DNA-directed RNA polymerase [Neoconidiobolus thromboides FSU 785]
MSATYDSNIAKIHRIYTNVRTMIESRNYRIVEDAISLDIFIREGGVDRSMLEFTAEKEGDSEDRILATFLSNASSGVQPVKDIYNKLEARNIPRCVIICEKKLTPAAVKGLLSFAPKFLCEVFEEKECQINITEHVLVPKHVLLTKEEKETLLKRYHLKDTQLPRIQQNDPVARYYGLRRGDVVKIVRNSETAGRYLTYRLCL